MQEQKVVPQIFDYLKGELAWNLNTAQLVEEVIRNNEGSLAIQGPIIVNTGSHTGRSPHDKFTVDEPSSTDNIWWGKVNKPFDADKFEELYRRQLAYIRDEKLYIQDCWSGADPKYRLGVRIITQKAWHSLFVRNMFINPKPEELENFQPDFTVIDCPTLHSVPEVDGTHSPTYIVVNMARKLVLIGGSLYGGEMKKSIFAVMNYMLPFENVLPMHCSANYGPDGDTAVFFGLSGTGKTTLSADPNRTLIGDDEHGWSDDGVFNFEGGCYAKVIRLSEEAEPEIYQTTRTFGTVLENVAFDPNTRMIDLDDASLTENTRAAYPIEQIPNADLTGYSGHPSNIIFLTADAFGVLPPISKLTPQQAMYHFIAGYTAKVAGTERGVTEPQATFSACFGAPFMMLHPNTYAKLLGRKIEAHNVDVWLINTGWSGGPYGVGSRMKIRYTRAMVNAALSGELKNVEYTTDPIFGVSVPTSCPNVPPEVLIPRNTWADPIAYDAQAKKLAQMFNDNFKEFADEVSPEILAAAPKV